MVHGNQSIDANIVSLLHLAKQQLQQCDKEGIPGFCDFTLIYKESNTTYRSGLCVSFTKWFTSNLLVHFVIFIPQKNQTQI